jgi:hypothetical protein
MRHIHIEPGLRVRFAGRNEAFNEGVEIGLLAANMAAHVGEFTATLASMFLTGRRRPKLRLVGTGGLQRFAGS